MVKQQWTNIHIQFCETSNIILQKKRCVRFGFRTLLCALEHEIEFINKKPLFQSLVVFFPTWWSNHPIEKYARQIGSFTPICLGWRIPENIWKPPRTTFSAFDICRIREFVPTFRHRSGHRAIYKITRLNPTTSLAFRLWLTKITAIQPDNLERHSWQPMKDRTKNINP